MWLGILVLLFIAQKVNQIGYEPYNDGLPPRVEYGDVIGIDFGRDYSRVGFVSGYTFELISDEQGRTAIPNYVAFPKVENNVGPPIVGFEAKEQAESNPENTFYDFRRLIGRNSSDPDVKKAIKELPYTILDDFDPVAVRVGVKNDYSSCRVEESTAMILKKLKGMAERHLNSTVTNAVITAPYEFNAQQRDIMIEAARLAELNVLKLVDEPTAIATAYRLGSTYCDGKGDKVDCRYIIYEDDVRAPHLSLYEAGRDGNGVLGTIVDDHENNPRSSFWASLLGQLSLAKSEPPTAESQAKRILELADRLLFISRKTGKEVDGLIVITSDADRTSFVQQLLETHYPNAKTIKSYDDFTPDQATVCGASMFADSMSPPRVEPSFMDVVLLSLGVEMKNGSFLRIVQRNHVPPLRKSAVLFVTADSHSIVPIPIYEGERELAARNHRLGYIELSAEWFGDEVHERWMQEVEVNGKVEIELAYEFDANEILAVVVRKGEESLTMFRGPVMGKQWRWRDVEDIVKEAEEAREEDIRALTEEIIVGVGEIEVKDGGS
ncbi:actin-like ATPase domain-containing protein [Cadophora sp. DSE1049]|nr:actin-like ATPase domain-containing protein [Cadophora sp. DSE1049]